jgi:hypothetical protein
MGNSRILLVSTAPPYNNKTGGEQRTALMHEALSRLGDIDVIIVRPSNRGSFVAEPQEGVIANAFWRRYPLGYKRYQPDAKMNIALRNYGVDLNQYNLIVGRYLGCICKLEIPNHVKTIVDLDDWNYRFPGKLIGVLKSRYVRWLANRELPRFNSYFFVSERDQSLHPELRSTVLPNIPFNFPALPYPQSTIKNLLFVGTFFYEPNRQAIEHFLSHIWPQVKQEKLDTQLVLAGMIPDEFRDKLEQYKDVVVKGFVDDLADVYRDAAFTIAPIYSGGGTNIKILESLAYGRGCVITTHCANGFKKELYHAGLMVANNDTEFATRCIDWLEDPDSLKSSVERGYVVLKKHYTRTCFYRQVSQQVSLILDE